MTDHPASPSPRIPPRQSSSTSTYSTQSTTTEVKQPKPFKIVIIGDASTGKTALRQRYLAGSFASSYRATIGCDFVSKVVQLRDGTSVSLSLWDTAGQDRFRSLAASFYRGADACIMIYSDTKSLVSLRTWFDEFKARRPVEDEGDELAKFCWVAVGTKVDVWEQRGDEDSSVPKDEDVQRLFEELLPLPRQRRIVSTGTNGQAAGGYDVDGEQPHAPHSPTVQSPLPYCDNPLDQAIEDMPKRIDVLPSSTRPSTRHPRAQSKRTSSSQGKYDTAKTTPSSIYHTPSASLSDLTDAASVRSDDTITPSRPPSPLTPEDFPSPTEEYLSAELKREAARGVDVYMATSPPRAPHSLGMIEQLNHGHQGGPALMRQESRLAGLDERNEAGEAGAVERDSPRKQVQESVEYDYSRDGIKTFKASAKTGHGVDQVFEYVAERVMWKLKRDERDKLNKSPAGPTQAAPGVVRLTSEQKSRTWKEACCS